MKLSLLYIWPEYLVGKYVTSLLPTYVCTDARDYEGLFSGDI